MIVYGKNPVRELLRARRRKVKQISATAQTAHESWLAGFSVEIVTRVELDERVGVSEHQGICVDAGPYPYVQAEGFLKREAPLLIALDGIQDPQNLGAICRTAECAGIDGVIIPQRRVAEITPAACKASAGAVEHLPIARVRNLADFLHAAKKTGCWCYGAAADASVDYRQPDYTGNGVVLVFGAEGKGLRPRVADICDELISLPIYGKTESLNVSTTAAIVAYHVKSVV